jgi:hypothetical protein
LEEVPWEWLAEPEEVPWEWLAEPEEEPWEWQAVLEEEPWEWLAEPEEEPWEWEEEPWEWQVIASFLGLVQLPFIVWLQEKLLALVREPLEQSERVSCEKFVCCVCFKANLQLDLEQVWFLHFSC